MIPWDELARYAFDEAPHSRAVALLHGVSAVEQAMGKSEETFKDRARRMFPDATVPFSMLVEAWEYRNDLAHFGKLPSYDSVRRVLPTLAAAHAQLCGRPTSALRTRLESLLPAERPKTPHTMLLEVPLQDEQAHSTISLLRDHKDPRVAAVSLCIAASWTEKGLRPALKRNKVDIQGLATKELIRLAISERLMPGGADWNAAVVVRNRIAHEGYVPTNRELEGAIEQYLAAAHALASGKYTEEFHGRRRDAEFLRVPASRFYASVSPWSLGGEGPIETLNRIHRESGVPARSSYELVPQALTTSREATSLKVDLNPSDVLLARETLDAAANSFGPAVAELTWRRDSAALLNEHNNWIAKRCGKILSAPRDVTPKKARPKFGLLNAVVTIGALSLVGSTIGCFHGCGSGCSDDGIWLGARRGFAETMGGGFALGALSLFCYFAYHLVELGLWTNRVHLDQVRAVRDEGDRARAECYEFLERTLSRRAGDARFAQLLNRERARIDSLIDVEFQPSLERPITPWLQLLAALVLLGAGLVIANNVRTSPSWTVPLKRAAGAETQSRNPVSPPVKRVEGDAHSYAPPTATAPSSSEFIPYRFNAAGTLCGFRAQMGSFWVDDASWREGFRIIDEATRERLRGTSATLIAYRSRTDSIRAVGVLFRDDVSRRKFTDSLAKQPIRVTQGVTRPLPGVPQTYPRECFTAR